MEKKITYAEAILVEEIKVLKVFNDLNVPKDLKLLNDPNNPKDPKLLNDPNDLKFPNDLNDLKILKDPKLPNRRILVAGNRSGGVAVAAMRRWPEAEVVAHAFDYHHARAIRKRLLDEGLPARNVRCSAGVGVEGTDALQPTEEMRQPFDAAFFMTTPQSMPAELVLDQLQDIHANLVEGGALYAAFEGEARRPLPRREARRPCKDARLCRDMGGKCARRRTARVHHVPRLLLPPQPRRRRPRPRRSGSTGGEWGTGNGERGVEDT